MGLESILGGLTGGALDFGSSAYAINQSRQNFKHRYQWTMEDMRKAGLNPMLAASMGGGQPPPVQDPKLGQAALSSARSVSDLRTAKRQQENLYSDTFKKQTEEATNRALGDTHTAQTRLLNVQTALEASKIPRAGSDKAFDASTPGAWLRYINRISRSVQGDRD